MPNNCIYRTSDGYCELHSDGVELWEPCIEGPCLDEKQEDSNVRQRKEQK